MPTFSNHQSAPLSHYLRSKGDTDIYLLFMGQVIRQKFSDLSVEYELVQRSDEVFPPLFVERLRALIDQMPQLTISDAEIQYVQKHHPYLNTAFLEWFQQTHRFRPEQVSLSLENQKLRISITGLWAEVVYWETPLLAMMSQLRNELHSYQPHQDWKKNASDAFAQLEDTSTPIQIVEFGTRRRFSAQFHQEVLKLIPPQMLVGTSNIFFAHAYHLVPLGTIAHQFVMAMAALFGVHAANAKTLEIWQEFYQGKLATALTDTYTSAVFFEKFFPFSSIFTTLRQDSGDPFIYVDQVAKYLQQHGLSPAHYRILFSDRVTLPQAQALAKYTHAQGMRSSFGIGSVLTHDFAGYTPPDISIKPTRFITSDGTSIPVAKISDSLQKRSGSGLKKTLAELTLSE